MRILLLQTFQISGFGSKVVYRPVNIIGSEIPHCRPNLEIIVHPSILNAPGQA